MLEAYAVLVTVLWALLLWMVSIRLEAVIDAQDAYIASQSTLIEAQADNLGAYKRYVSEGFINRETFIAKLIEHLRFWMPDETMVKPDAEGPEWYASIDTIFAAERLLRVEGERKES